MYKLYHNTIWTDGLKHVIGYKPDRGNGAAPDPEEPDPELPDVAPPDVPLEGPFVPKEARCKHCKPFQFASKSHAFWLCPTVKEAWDQLLEWAILLFPKLAAHLRNSRPEQVQLCWPQIRGNLPPLLIHLHSLTSNAIWRNHCRIGDLARNKADLSEETQLVNLVQVALKFRANVEFQRARYKEAVRLEKITSGQGQCLDNTSKYSHKEAMTAVWDHPPHITVGDNGIVFGKSMKMGPPTDDLGANSNGDPAPEPDPDDNPAPGAPQIPLQSC